MVFALTKKLLFWISEEMMYFSLAKFLQEDLEADYYGIIESHSGVKKFIDEQSVVNFKKTWHFHDHVFFNNKEPDYEYLNEFEKKYHINLSTVSYSERAFHPEFNKFHKFTNNEILNLIERECKLYEQIIDEIQPDIFLANVITRHNNYLLYLLCKSKNIDVLTLESAKFGNRFTISNEINKIDNPSLFSSINLSKTRNQEELLHFLKQFKPYKGLESKISKKIPRLEKTKAAFNLFTSRKNPQYSKFYTRSKSSLLLKGSSLISSIHKKNIENFINKEFEYEIGTKPFIYFSLTSEPERDLLICAPFFTNQISLITNIAKSIPVGYYLYVKDHPVMEKIGWRTKDFYKQIMNLPNVKLFHPSIPNDELIRKSSLVITVAGTAGFEAAFYKIPSIVFIDADFSVLSSVFTLKNIDNLPNTISKALTTKVDILELDKYVTYVTEHSFEFNRAEYTSDFNNTFYYVGYGKLVDIQSDTMKDFLDRNRPILKNLVVENSKRILDNEK